jgi:protein-disulfide isomerase
VAHWPRALVFLAASLAAAQTAIPAGAKSALDKKTFETYLRHLNMWGPQITVEISDPKPSPSLPGFQDVPVKASLGPRSIEYTYQVSKDGQNIVQGNIYNIQQNPFRDELALLDKTGAPRLGPAQAAGEIVLFSDFQCTYCKELAKTIQQSAMKEYGGKVRVYFRDLPLEAIHPWARPAAIAGRCVYQQNESAFWKFHDWMFEQQSSISPENVKARVMEWVAKNGLDPLRLGPCLESKEAAAEVDRSIEQGRALKVGSTPTMFVNGRRLAGNVEWPNLKAVIDAEIAYSESCCSVELKPAPGTGKP